MAAETPIRERHWFFRGRPGGIRDAFKFRRRKSAHKPKKNVYDFPFESLPFFGSNKELNRHLGAAAQRLAPKLELAAPNLEELGISPYSQRYMGTIFGKTGRRIYNLTKYAHILSNALERFSPNELEDVTFVDYGAGHGTLALLAKEAGVGCVVHSDIFSTSWHDAQVLGKTIDVRADHYFLGDSPEFRSQMETLDLCADAIANYDVLEHVYSFRRYFLDLASVTKQSGRWFMASGANLYNDSIRNQLVETHGRLEGTLDSSDPTTYLNLRLRFIREAYPDLLPVEAETLAIATRGWRKEDIFRAVDIFVSSGHVVQFSPAENNTSDPRNGNWCENMVPIEVFLNHPTLLHLSRTISVQSSAPWGVLIKSNESEAECWRQMPSRNVKDALKEAPYYCLDVEF